MTTTRPRGGPRAPAGRGRARGRALTLWSTCVGVVLALLAVAALGLSVLLGSQTGQPDYGIPGLLGLLSLATGAPAAVHLWFARSAAAPGPRGRAALLAAALACPLLVGAALVVAPVSVDAPVLLLGYAATFLPHVVRWARGRRRAPRPTLGG